MTPLRQHMLEDMQLRGLAPKTQEAYLRAVRQLAEYIGKPPDQIIEEELRDYFLNLKNEKKASRSACTIALCGIKFFFERTLKQQWHTFDIVRPPKEKKLPVVLSREEVWSILGQIKRFQYQACLCTIYACGLRLNEGIQLQVIDIDRKRHLLHIRHGKGHRDRYIPLPATTLSLLRQDWCSHRHPIWLFPSSHNNQRKESKPICASGVQRAFKAAVQTSGVNKAVTVHTLRHSWATSAGRNYWHGWYLTYLGSQSILSPPRSLSGSRWRLGWYGVAIWQTQTFFPPGKHAVHSFSR